MLNLFITCVHTIIAVILFVMAQTIASFAYQLPFTKSVNQGIYALGFIILVFILIVTYSTKVAKISVDQLRFKKTSAHISLKLWTLVALLLPSGLICFYVFCVPGSLNYAKLSQAEIISKVVETLLTVGITASVTEELLFRGFIMRLFEERLGFWSAILMPSILFAILHIVNIPNATSIDIMMLLMAGMSVGAMFSLIAMQSSSIWPGVIIHCIWNSLIVGSLIHVGIKTKSVAFFSYTMKADSILLTGGRFGIESSIFASLCYVMISWLAWSLYRKKQSKLNANL